MVARPVDPPVTSPVAKSTEAISGALEDQVPPAAVFVNNTEEAAQADDAPEIAAGEGMTATVAVAAQPVDSV